MSEKKTTPLPTRQDAKGRETTSTHMAKTGAEADVAYISPNQAIPIVFVPGIMGSPLLAMGESQKFAAEHMKNPKWAWNPNNAWWMLRRYGALSPALRKNLLNPDQTRAISSIHDADPEALKKVLEGHSPFGVAADPNYQLNEALQRGWGSVLLESYVPVLDFLETNLKFIFYHGHPYPGMDRTRPREPSDWGTLKGYSKLTDDELCKASGWRYPVYAVGYNWLRSNADAAAYLEKRIEMILADCRKRLKLKCDKVILVSHSMGGLVTRAYAKKNPDRVLGIVHGVQPATGAGAAYHRVRGGWEAGGYGIKDGIGAWILGPDARHVMSVFSNASGPLELLPNHLYGPGWLKVVHHEHGKDRLLFSLPKADPYDEIYAEGNRWWRLIHPAIAHSPLSKDEIPEGMSIPKETMLEAWDSFRQKLRIAKKFHYDLGGYYHPQTYAHYGADEKRKTWNTITWRLESKKDGTIKAQPPIATQAADYALVSDFVKLGVCFLRNTATAGDMLVNENGVGVIRPYAGDAYRAAMMPVDDPGDGTVPSHSGKAPAAQAQFAASMAGFTHQDSYLDEKVRSVTLYSILHLAKLAKDIG